MCLMDIMNVLRTGLNMSISRIRIMGMLENQDGRGAVIIVCGTIKENIKYDSLAVCT